MILFRRRAIGVQGGLLGIPRGQGGKRRLPQALGQACSFSPDLGVDSLAGEEKGMSYLAETEQPEGPSRGL